METTTAKLPGWRRILVWTRWPLVVLLLAAPGLISLARAEDAVEVSIGSTGLILPNHAVTQDKLYLDEDQALLDRIGTLLADTDCLLRRLHALPPELQGTAALDEVPTVELAALIGLALANNPDLAPLKSELAAEAARTRQAGALQDPMLMFNVMRSVPRTGWLGGSNSAGTMPETVMARPDGMPMTQFMLGAKQMFMSYGKRRIMRSIAHMDERLTELELADRELKLAGQVSDLYYRIAGTKAQIAVMDRNIELMRLLLELGERKYALGTTPQALVINGQVQLTEMQRQRLDMQQMLEEDLAMLNGLLGYPAGFDPAELDFSFDYPASVVPEWTAADILPRALELRPDYLKQEAKHEQQGLRLELAHREYRPNYTLSLSFGVDVDRRDTISAGIELPLSLHKSERQDAMVQETYAMQAMSNDELKMIQNMLTTEIDSARVRLKSLSEQIELYRQGLAPQARLALDSNVAGYAANMMDFSDLLMAQQKQQDLELQLEQKYIEYVATLTKLQLTTAGAFDPRPYLGLPAATESSDAVAPPLDIQQILEQLEQPAEPPTIEEMLNQLDQADQAPAPPAIDSDFLEAVGLAAPPVTAEPAEIDSQNNPPPTEQPAPPASPEGDAPVAPSGPAGDFYAPFVPSQEPPSGE